MLVGCEQHEQSWASPPKSEAASIIQGSLPQLRRAGPKAQGDGLAYSDLREWIKALEHAGELRRVRTEVDPVLEIAEITDRVSKAGRPNPGIPNSNAYRRVVRQSSSKTSKGILGTRY